MVNCYMLLQHVPRERRRNVPPMLSSQVGTYHMAHAASCIWAHSNTHAYVCVSFVYILLSLARWPPVNVHLSFVIWLLARWGCKLCLTNELPNFIFFLIKIFSNFALFCYYCYCFALVLFAVDILLTCCGCFPVVFYFCCYCIVFSYYYYCFCCMSLIFRYTRNQIVCI